MRPFGRGRISHLPRLAFDDAQVTDGVDPVIQREPSPARLLAIKAKMPKLDLGDEVKTR